MEAPSTSGALRSGGMACRAPPRRRGLLQTLLPDQLSVDRRQLLDHRPPGVVLSDPARCDGNQRLWQRDLLGTPALERDGQVGGAMALALGAVAARLATAQGAHHHAAAQDLLEGREPREDPAPALEERAAHILRLYRRKTSDPQLRGGASLRTHANQPSDQTRDSRKLPGIGARPEEAPRLLGLGARPPAALKVEFARAHHPPLPLQ